MNSNSHSTQQQNVSTGSSESDKHLLSSVVLLETIDPLKTIDPESALEQSGDLTPALAPMLATISADDHGRQLEIVTAFQAAWESGAMPRLSDFLPVDAALGFRDFVAFKLVLVDIEQRRIRSHPVSEQDYLMQAPQCKAAIKFALNSSTIKTNKTTELTKPVSSDENDSLQWSIEAGPNSVARYAPLGMHARGGLGAVYRAKDNELGRIVALKRILPARENDSNSKARFVFEAEVTGALEHPGIVPVYGLSRYGDNLPYYAMRFIQGQSLSNAIKSFHDENPISSSKTFYDRAFRQLLRRLIDSCNALHYAHERGVLHRDIKPDNIMLGHYGETLVVDWGLAKVQSTTHDFDQPQTGSAFMQPLNLSGSGDRTSQGVVVGTPMYMSPEQALGMHEQLTAAADIYSLGAILFNMICNLHPIEGKTTREIISKVRTGSTRDLTLVAPKAPRALVSICKKAMATTPEDRYGTAIELSEDLDRWMSAEAVKSHDETWIERISRLLWRYRNEALTIASALIVLTLVSIAASLLIYKAKKNEEIAKLRETMFKGEAVQRYRDSRQSIDSWLVQSSDALEYFPGNRSVRSRLLTLAAEDYAKLTGLVSEDPELELERGRALIKLGDLHRSMKKHSEARESFRKAITLLDQGATKTDGSNQLPTKYAIESANARSRLALDYASERDYKKSDLEFRTAIEQLKKINETSRDLSVYRYLAAAWTNWGDAAFVQLKLGEATARLNYAIQAWDHLGSNSTTKDLLDRLRTEELQGRVKVSEGNHQAAIERFNKAIERFGPLANDNDPNYLDSIASLLVSRSLAQQSLGRHREQMDSLALAMTHFRTLRRAIPDMPRYTENLVLTLTDFGLILFEEERCREALTHLQEAGELLDDLIRDYGAISRFEDMRAANHDAIGQVQLTLGDSTNAIKSIAKSITTYQQLSLKIPESPDYIERLAIAQSHYSQCLAVGSPADFNKIALAIEGFETSIATLKELINIYPDIPQYRASLGHVYEAQGRFLFGVEDAASNVAFTEAIETWKALGERRTPATSEELAWLLLSCENEKICSPSEAIVFSEEALKASPDNQNFQSTLGVAQSLNKQKENATKTLKPILQSSEIDRTGNAWFAIAVFHKLNGEESKTRYAVERGEKWYENQAPMHKNLSRWKALLHKMNSP